MASISCSILRTAQRLRPHASLDANFILRRSFFASSTDHTKLVSSAIVHRIADGPLTSYCLVPPDTALDDNFWVRRLCLASLNLENGTVYGAKIVQKGLGSPETVIARLLEEALVDVPGGQVKALASLDGLCKWVSEEIKIGGNEILEDLKEKDERAYGAVEAIATGIPRKGHSVVGIGTFNDGKDGWEELARQFVTEQLNVDTKVYGKKGTLSSIDYLADNTPEYIKTAGGTMASYLLK